jgi:uncharacterized protein (DUF362 family)
MIHLSKEEKNLKTVMGLSTLVYLVAGFTFAIAPAGVITVINRLSVALIPALEMTPLSLEKFWLALAFSMMMTITILSFTVYINVRRNRNYTFPLLISKSVSSLSSVVFFIFSDRYFAYLVIFLVDGLIFWITLVFYLRSLKGFFMEQTDWLNRIKKQPESSGPAKVVVVKGEDKFALFDELIVKTEFIKTLEDHFAKSGKSRDEYRIIIKPNFMYLHHRKDISTYTDPELVEALVDKIVNLGFTNVTLVEAQSTLGNYYANRDVVTVAKYVGYSTDKNYRIIDLTEEMVPYDYGGKLGKHFVGPTWRDADFRISFAKNKTHVFCHYTLTLKNIYGTLPMQNKLREYHTKREYDWPTIESLKHFPVHFGFIDAIYSADGAFGVIVDPTPVHTKTLIGGENLLAVDYVGAKKMGLNPDDPHTGRFLPLAMQEWGKPEITVDGDMSVYKPWTNVSEVYIKSLDIIEEAYEFSNWWFEGLTAMDKCFPLKKAPVSILIMRKILIPFKRLFFTYDYLKR